MKYTSFLCAVALLTATTSALSSCKQEDVAPTPGMPSTPGTPGTGGSGVQPTNPNTPSTAIPDELVGTWFADGNTGPLTTNWDQGTFQGNSGFAEFRTMVLTKDGKEAVEYTSEVFNGSDETQRRLYQLTGTLEYQANATPTTLTFHAQRGVMRVFSSKYTGYKESFIALADLQAYASTLLRPQATTFPTTTNYLNAQRQSGSTYYSVKYQKVASTGGTTPGAPSSGLYTSPPATGTYVQIGSLYYPTAVIGNREWMTVNYAGPGGITDSQKPQYGTFFKYADLSAVTVPAGWRIPSKQDYVDLLTSQGLALDAWNSTDGSDLASKQKLGQLMAPNVWRKQDGFATNSSGFTALPGNLRVTTGNPNGEGSNGIFWTSDRNANTDPLAFQLIQLPSDTYANIQAWPAGFNPPHIPVRLVRTK